MKYIVIYLDLISANCDVLSSHNHYKDALSALNETIDKHDKFNNPSYYKKYHDNKELISIYQVNYLFPKTLIGRYFIKTFEEPSCRVAAASE
jgi:hypothetical protein